jgi:hypothetical protein
MAAACLHGGLEHSELVRPGRKAAVSAVAVQLVQAGDERVVCRLHGEIVEVVLPAPAERRPSLGGLDAGATQEVPAGAPATPDGSGHVGRLTPRFTDEQAGCPPD